MLEFSFVNENLLNSCFTILLNKHYPFRRDKMLYSNIKRLLDTVKVVEKDIAITETERLQKFKALKLIIDHLLDGRDILFSLNDVTASNRFNSIKDFLVLRQDEKLKENTYLASLDILESAIKQLNYYPIFEPLAELNEKAQMFEFDSAKADNEEFENMIIKAHNIINVIKRNTLKQDKYDITLGEDCDLSPIFKETKNMFNRYNKTPTGFDLLDKYLRGGFEGTRLYVFGGGSGSGKSTILINMICNAATHNNYIEERLAKRKVFLYITLENQISESIMRFACKLFSLTDEQYLRRIRTEEDEKKMMKDIRKKFTSHNSFMKPIYFPSNSIRCFELRPIIETALDRYEDCIIMGLYVDYLDLFRGEKDNIQQRFTLGEITQELKNIAVDYSLPVITCTQLGRSAYKIDNSFDLNVSQISESIKKVEHADFVGLMARNVQDPNLIHFKIGKNRSGPPDKHLDFDVDLERFSFLSCKKSKYDKKVEKKNESFGGMSTLDDRGFKFDGTSLF